MAKCTGCGGNGAVNNMGIIPLETFITCESCNGTGEENETIDQPRRDVPDNPEGDKTLAIRNQDNSADLLQS